MSLPLPALTSRLTVMRTVKLATSENVPALPAFTSRLTVMRTAITLCHLGDILVTMQSRTVEFGVNVSENTRILHQRTAFHASAPKGYANPRDRGAMLVVRRIKSAIPNTGLNRNILTTYVETRHEILFGSKTSIVPLANLTLHSTDARSPQTSLPLVASLRFSVFARLVLEVAQPSKLYNIGSDGLLIILNSKENLIGTFTSALGPRCPQWLERSPPTKASRVRFPEKDAPGYLHVGIQPNDVAGWRVFSAISCFPHPCTLALLHTHLVSSSSALNTISTDHGQLINLPLRLNLVADQPRLSSRTSGRSSDEKSDSFPTDPLPATESYLSPTLAQPKVTGPHGKRIQFFFYLPQAHPPALTRSQRVDQLAALFKHRPGSTRPFRYPTFFGPHLACLHFGLWLEILISLKFLLQRATFQDVIMGDPQFLGVDNALDCYNHGDLGSIQTQVFPYSKRSRRLRCPASFLRVLPFPPHLHSIATPYSSHFALISCQDLIVQTRANRTLVKSDSEVLRANEGEVRWVWGSIGMKGQRKREISEKTGRPAATSGYDSHMPGIEPDGDGDGTYVLVLDGDGDGTYVLVLVGDGDGTYILVLDGDGDGTYVLVLDGDSDGTYVLVLVGDGDGTYVLVLDGDGDGTYVLVLDGDGTYVLVLDGDGDGTYVLVLVGDGDGTYVLVLDGDGDGTYVLILDGDGDGTYVVVLDGDGDGTYVLVLDGDGDGTYVLILDGDGDGTYVLVLDGDGTYVLVLDGDGDGTYVLVLDGDGDGTYVLVLDGDGDGTYVLVLVGDGYWTYVLVLDGDDDGTYVLVLDGDDDGTYVLVLDGDGDGTYVLVLVGDSGGTVLRAVVDANYKFVLLAVGSYRKEGDSGIFDKSNIGKKFRSGNMFPPPCKLPASDVVSPRVFVVFIFHNGIKLVRIQHARDCTSTLALRCVDIALEGARPQGSPFQTVAANG
ncbi:hypothetical protein PR048_008018 [Dryococelus australis]|uniref:Uncharacterized protein n=1 Tax=Dryococelus australis TaxID=614101 RepID=A0ABQ9HVW5_9NEOP|nr:hypothetical protein PR048_008018 [Dryococelus australis]